MVMRVRERGESSRIDGRHTPSGLDDEHARARLEVAGRALRVGDRRLVRRRRSVDPPEPYVPPFGEGKLHRPYVAGTRCRDRLAEEASHQLRRMCRRRAKREPRRIAPVAPEKEMMIGVDAYVTDRDQSASIEGVRS